MKGEHSLRLLWEVLEVSRSGYYQWRADRPTARGKRDAELAAHIDGIVLEQLQDGVRHRRKMPATRHDGTLVAFDYFETFYNRTRRHSSLDYASPVAFEIQHTNRKDSHAA